MFRYRRIYSILIVIAIIIFILGISITLFDDQLARILLSNSEEADGIKTEWIGFWGNLLGSCLQGIATAAGIFVTVQMFTTDKLDKKELEKNEREREENDQYISNFGKVLSAYDQLYQLLSKYNSLDSFYRKRELVEDFAHTINDGEIFARLSVMQRVIYNH